MAIKKDAWQLAQVVVSSLPPYLDDNDLTIERFYERNKDKLSRNEAREVLERLVADGKMEKQERRKKGKGGGYVMVYQVKQTAPLTTGTR